MDDRAPGLDGIRGIAVLSITAYHLGWINGGILSVSVFFTLSGYLITSILLSSIQKRGSVDLKSFWFRRARRLLPALIMLLVVVLGAAAVARPLKLHGYTRQAVAASLYVANWSTIASGDNYFNRFDGLGPFDHLWSLAIEEQFYAVWPVLLLGLFALSRRTRALPIVVTAALAALSAWWMARLYLPTAMNNTRAYEGTDARAAPILIGALTAMFVPLGGVPKLRRGVLEAIGWVSLVVVVVLVARVDEHSPFLYRGSEALTSIETSALILAAAHPQTAIARVLGLAPFRWLGVRSYGLYLWHMPIVAFMPASAFAGHPYLRGGLQLGLIVALAALSWSLLEDPIRRHGLTTIRAARWWADSASLASVSAVALVPWPVFLSRASAKNADALVLALETEKVENKPVELPPPPAPGPLLTSCTRLVHIGDSQSLALTFRSYIPKEEERLEARYRAVGVRFFTPEISGGRAIVEKISLDQQSAYEVVRWKAETGHKGCYVFALGVGDSSTTKGSIDALSKRMDWMMRAAAGAPVLWTTTKTLHAKGPYQNAYMDNWNESLVLACARYPNMRVYDWAAEVQDSWFLPDEIHPNAEGARERAARIAAALAVAFPRDGAWPTACVVQSKR
jgi:peptidoglycan/LPS O-acetylase OafA/YrhL